MGLKAGSAPRLASPPVWRNVTTSYDPGGFRGPGGSEKELGREWGRSVEMVISNSCRRGREGVVGLTEWAQGG